MDLLKLLSNDDINDDSDSDDDDDNCNTTTATTRTELCTSSSFSTTSKRNDHDNLNDVNKRQQKYDVYTSTKYDNNSNSTGSSNKKAKKYNPKSNPTITVASSSVDNNKKRHITTTTTALNNFNHSTDDTTGNSATIDSDSTILQQQQQQQQQQVEEKQKDTTIIFCDTCLSNYDSDNNNINGTCHKDKRTKFVRSKHHIIGNWSGYIYTPIHFVLENNKFKPPSSASASATSSSSKYLSSNSISFWNIATIAVQSYYNVLQQRHNEEEEEQQQQQQPQQTRSTSECNMKSILFHQHFPCKKCLQLLQRSGSTTASNATTCSSNTNRKVKKNSNTTTITFHMSLSRTYYLQEASIDSFVQTLRNRLQSVPSFSIRFLSKNTTSTSIAPVTRTDTCTSIKNKSSLTPLSSSSSLSEVKRICNNIDILLNDDNTRCFLVWCINDNQSIVQLTKLVQQYINPLLVLSYQQTPYYDNPNFHISLASHKVVVLLNNNNSNNIPNCQGNSKSTSTSTSSIETVVGCGTNRNNEKQSDDKEKFRITLRDEIRTEFYNQLQLLSQHQGIISDDTNRSHRSCSSKSKLHTVGNSTGSTSNSEDDDADCDSSTTNNSDDNDNDSTSKSLLKTDEEKKVNSSTCGKGKERTQQQFIATNELNEICSKQHKINTISCTFGTIRQHHFQLM